MTVSVVEPTARHIATRCGYRRAEDQRRALDAGFDHHLVKPPDLARLAELLGTVATPATEGRPRVLH